VQEPVGQLGQSGKIRCVADPRPAPDVSGLRVLHVVQKFSSGVGSAIAQYTRSLPEVDHHLLSGTPVDGEGDLAEQADFTSTHRMTGGHPARVRKVREVVRELRPDVVHAHSSHGGGYARLAVPCSRWPVVYTPHCYSFERRDVTAPTRAAFWLVEAVLALNTSAYGACSERELRLSGWPHRHAPGVLVPNIAPERRPRAARRAGRAPLLAGGGRLSPQKDPAFFLACVRRLRAVHPDLEAVWLGDGDPPERATLEEGGVTVTGWLPRAKALDQLAAAGLYLHSARWEGFPLMVAEAAAAGVPTLVRRLPTFRAVPAELTLACDEDLTRALACLDGGEPAAANVAAWAGLLQHHRPAEQRAALAELYSTAACRAHH
jgi:glycosyltransferase involved in cell wall biosynthesis